MRSAFVLPPTAKIAGSVRPTQWACNAEEPLGSQWANYTAQTKTRISTVTSPVPSGQTHSVKVDLVDGDVAYISDDFTADPIIGGPYGGPYGERTELAMSNPTTPVSLSKIFNKGDDLWIGWQVYVPATFNIAAVAYPESVVVNDWQIVTQMKQVGGMGVPAIHFGINNSRWEMWTADSTLNENLDSMKWHSASIATNAWSKFLLHVNFNTNPAFGFTELWGDLNGSGIVALDAKTFRITMKDPDTGAGQSQSKSHLRYGIYRNPAITGDGTLYFGRVGVAQSRSIAEALAFA